MNNATVNRNAKIIAALFLSIGMISISADQASFARGCAHPRRAEVLGRDRNLGREINHDYGHLGGHYGQLQREDNHIRREEQRDFVRNGGYLTGRQQASLNRQENRLQNQISHDWREGRPRGEFADRHPRRAEVLSRDARINGKLNADYGRLGGNYGSLKSQDQAIRQQEQADARANGGYITPEQKRQLNQEENQLNKEIRQDLH